MSDPEIFDTLVDSLSLSDSAKAELLPHLSTVRSQTLQAGRGRVPMTAGFRAAKREAVAGLQNHCDMSEDEAREFLLRIGKSIAGERRYESRPAVKMLGDPEIVPCRLQIELGDRFRDSTIQIHSDRDDIMRITVTGANAERDGKVLRDICRHVRDEMAPQAYFPTFTYTGTAGTVKIQQEVYDRLTNFVALWPEKFDEMSKAGRSV